jgi:Putative outer membrane beta-barrel porin, MtrB/PioB
VQKGNSWRANLGASYNIGQTGSVSAYVTQQYRQRDMTNHLKDDSFTLGLGAKQGGLLGGKLERSGDATYTVGKTGYNTRLNYTGATTGGLLCSDPSILSCGVLPDIKSTISQLKLTGTYQVQKNGKVALRYAYQKLNGADYNYNGYVYGGTPTRLMPTNQQLGSYSVNVISLSYVYNF